MIKTFKKLGICGLALGMGASLALTDLQKPSVNANAKVRTHKYQHKNSFRSRQAKNVRYLTWKLQKLGVRPQSSKVLVAFVMENNPSLNKYVRKVKAMRISNFKQLQGLYPLYYYGEQQYNNVYGSNNYLMHYLASNLGERVPANRSNKKNRRAIAVVNRDLMAKRAVHHKRARRKVAHKRKALKRNHKRSIRHHSKKHSRKLV